MKKVFMLLILLMLGMSMNLFADDQTIVSGQEKAVVSNDKSKIHLVRTTFIITVDTIKDYPVNNRARYYLKDRKIVDQLISTGIANPTDSLLPAKSHIFYVGTWLKRQLRINDGVVIYETIAGYQKLPAYLLEFFLSISFSAFLIFYGYIKVSNRSIVLWISGMSTVFFFCWYLETAITKLDLVLCCGILFFPALLFLVFNLIDKRKNKNISKSNLLVRSDIITKNFGPIKRKDPVTK